MRYVFADYTLDTRLQELRCAGQPVALRPKVFQLLIYLVRHHDRVVPKTELLEQLWPGQFIGDATLNSCLKDLRQALGDRGETQQVIQTLRRRGYRFVVPLEMPHEPLPEAPSPNPTPMPAVNTAARPGLPAVALSSPSGAGRLCPTCQQVQRPEARYCMMCGTRLADRCGSCDQAIPQDATFCPACGQPAARPALSVSAVPSAPGASVLPPEQGYKNVTVLVCALTDAPARATELGAEVMYRLMQALFVQAEEVVSQYAGTITQWGGDGFIALFGAPVAYEDHAWRALLAAYALRGRLGPPLTLPGGSAALALAVAIGLHTGPVVVGRLAHAQQQLYMATGPTLYLASQLQQLAGPGDLLLSAVTYEHVQPMVQVQRREALMAATGAGPVAVYALQGLAPQHGEFPWRGGRQLSQFVGREQELALLHERLAQALEGQGQVVSLIGEPGIGKSRLLYEFQHQRRGQTVLSYAGRCLSYASAMPYTPIVTLLRQICGVTDTDSAESITTKLGACLQTAQRAPDDRTPYLQRLLGGAHDAEALATRSPEAVKQHTFTAVRQFLLALSQQQPLILTLEDVHWIDKTSEDFLALFVESCTRAAVLLLVTYRPGYRPPWLDKSYATQLALQPLPTHESQRLVESLVPARTVSPDILQALLAKADGNPLFLEELARTMLVDGEALAEVAVPDTIHGVLMARIDRLPDAAKRLLQMASIQGRTVSPALLGSLWDDPDDMAAPLTTLQQQEFLYEQVGLEEPCYVFKHALTQEVAYSSMLSSSRHTFHLTIGQALETLYADHLDDALPQLAYHYGRSTDAVKAIAYLSQLAARAVRSFAHVEARTAYQLALQHVEGLPVGERDRCRLDLLLRQAFSLSILGRFRELHDLLVPQHARLAQLHEPALTGQYYFRLGMTLTYLGSVDQARQHARRALAAAEHCQDIAMQGMAYHLLAFTSYSLGHCTQGLDYGRKAVALLATTGEWHWLGLAYWDVSSNATYLGEFVTALEALTHTRALGEAHEDRRLLHFAAVQTGVIHTLRGAWDMGIEAYQRVLAGRPDPVTAMSAQLYLGQTYLEQGQLEQAIPLLTQVVHHCQQLQLRAPHSRAAALLAQALLLDKRLEPALHMAQQALHIGQELAYPYCVALAQRALGRIAQAQGDARTAEQLFHAALDAFNSLSMRYEQARTHLLLAQLAHSQGHRAALSTHLAAAHRLFQTLQVPHYVACTERLARACVVALS